MKTDLLHLLELKCISSKDRARISKRLQACLLWRRERKDTIVLLEPLVQFLNTGKGKLVLNHLPKVLGHMRKEEKHIANRSYAPRLMTYEEFENALVREEPNAVTYTAIEEGEAMATDPSTKTYDSIPGLMAALDS